jgi:hypothetical protein
MLDNEQLHSLCRSLIVVRLIKSRGLRWAGRVTRIKEGINVFSILTGINLQERDL